MIMFLICMILCIAGIVGFYTNFLILVYIGAVFNLIENLIEFFSGRQKSLITIILAGLIGWACTGTLAGICVGLCFESVLLSLTTLPVLLIMFKSKGK